MTDQLHGMDKALSLEALNDVMMNNDNTSIDRHRLHPIRVFHRHAASTRNNTNLDIPPIFSFFTA